MSMLTLQQEVQIAQTLQTHITEHIAYDNPNLRINEDVALVEQGIIDSMAIVRLIGFIEDTWDVMVEPTDVVIENFGTIRAMTTFIGKRLQEGQSA
jgi:acyl carrier protein